MRNAETIFGRVHEYHFPSLATSQFPRRFFSQKSVEIPLANSLQHSFAHYAQQELTLSTDEINRLSFRKFLAEALLVDPPPFPPPF